MNGLIKFKSTADLQYEEATKEDSLRNEYQQALETNLASHIRKVWESNRLAKWEVYQRLLSSLRARKGEYSDSELAQIKQLSGADPIYLKLTGTKSRAAASWIRDIVLPIKDKPWGLEPTPIPEMPEDIVQNALKATMQQVQEMMQQGMQLTPDQVDEFTEKVKKNTLEQLDMIALQKTQNAEKKIEDIMIDGGFKKAIEEFIEDFVTYPFAVLKGPYYQTKTFLKWKNGQPVPTQEYKLCWRRVSPFDIFYSPYCSNIQEGDLIERVRFSRTTLYDLIGMEGYSEEAIRRVLEEHTNNQLQDWIWENFERVKLETSSTYLMSTPETIDGLHYWGMAKGEDLIDWGYKGKIDDPLKMYHVDAILIGRNVIRAEINKNPMGHRPYHSACWDSVPGSLIGISLPEQMEDHQKMVNATARALATNLSISSGPQCVVLADMLASGESMTDIYPMKIWQMKSSITGNSGKPVEFFQPEINAEALIAVMNTFEQKADDVTNVPRYSYGNEKIGGAGSTATGLSMLMNSAAKGIRRAIASVDLNVLQPTIYQTYVELMMKEPDPDIRGDVKVIAKGSAAILIKEQMLENNKAFLQLTTNEYDIAIMGKRGRAKLLTEIADKLDIDKFVVPSDEELGAQEQQERQMAQEQHQAEVMAQQAAAAPEAGAVPPEQLMQLEQQAKSLEQAEAQIEMKDKIVQKQAQEVQSEVKRLQGLQKQLEDQMAALTAQKIQMDLESKKMLSDIKKAKEDFNADMEIKHSRLEVATEKAKNEIESASLQHEKKMEQAKTALSMEAENLKAAAAKVKLVSATKKDETAKDGKASEKKEAAAASAVTDKAVAQALTQVAEAMKLIGSPKVVEIGNIQRDKDGKIAGATGTQKPVTTKAD